MAVQSVTVDAGASIQDVKIALGLATGTPTLVIDSFHIRATDNLVYSASKGDVKIALGLATGTPKYTITAFRVSGTDASIADVKTALGIGASTGTGFDVVVDSVSWTPTAPAAGDKVVFSAAIRNTGSSATPSVVHGIRFSVDGAITSWSDNSSTPLAAGASRTQTANSGPTGSNAWTATGGSHSVEAWFDDMNRLTAESNKTNNKLTKTVSISTPAGGDTVAVSSFSALQNALNAIAGGGKPDITITQSIDLPSSVKWPAVPMVTLRAASGVVLKHSGGMFKGLAGQGASNRTVLFYGITVDGGWNNNKSEAGDDNYSPLDFSNYGRVEFHKCRVQYSRRAGFYATGNGVLIFDQCSGYGVCRDWCWTNMTKDITITGCDIQNIRDDTGCHISENQGLTGRKVRCNNNKFLQAWGMKFLGGGDVIVEDNTCDLSGPYGIQMGIDGTTGEAGSAIHTGYVVRNNLFRNFVNWPNWAGTQWCIHLDTGGRVGGISVTGNTLIHLDQTNKRIRDLYPAATNGVFDKGGWIDPVLQPSGLGILISCSNSSDTTKNVVSGNTFTGAWGTQIHRG